MLIQQVRLVEVAGRPAPSVPVDVRIDDGVVTEVAPRLEPVSGEEVVAAEGRWAIPGLWDHHVHMSIWAPTFGWLDLAGTSEAAAAAARVGEHVATLPRDGSLVTGFGHRLAAWPQPPTVAQLDAVSGDHPVVLIAGDGHNGWLNSAALRLVGLPPRDTVLAENDWFPVFARLGELTGSGTVGDDDLRRAAQDAAARGIVGFVDMELHRGYRDWPERVTRGLDRQRVRVATYADGLDEVIAAGWRTGDPLPGSRGLVTMGPLKIIGDGSLSTRTACCREPYADAGDHAHGAMNLDADALTELLTAAGRSGLEVAVHAIGDATVGVVLDAAERTGARGSVEHAQLMTADDVRRIARLGLRASVQPAHLLDDRDVVEVCWPDRADRCFPFRDLLDAGTALALGSDAPVSPLDPWLAMAAAVHRSADERQAWHAEQGLTVAEALAASTDGRGTLAVGQPGDLVLLDADPLAPAQDTASAAAALRAMQVDTTVLAGEVTYAR